MDRPHYMAVLGSGLCIPDEATAASMGFGPCGLDLGILPPRVRRRTSLATRMAITAADRACRDAAVGTNLPAIFVSLAGEIQVTDGLCRAIAQQAFPLSPTAFHNSVHNTAAGYWSIAVDSMEPMQAMAGLEDGFALALIDAWSQIMTGTAQLLLVCYDEDMPHQLLPNAQWQPCALALVLGSNREGYPLISMPYSEESRRQPGESNLAARNPALQGMSLMQRLVDARPGEQPIQLASGDTPWLTHLILP